MSSAKNVNESKRYFRKNHKKYCVIRLDIKYLKFQNILPEIIIHTVNYLKFSKCVCQVDREKKVYLTHRYI